MVKPSTKVLIVVNVMAGEAKAFIYVGSTLITSARGRNEECAVADVVAAFRSSRYARKAG